MQEGGHVSGNLHINDVCSCTLAITCCPATVHPTSTKVIASHPWPICVHDAAISCTDSISIYTACTYLLNSSQKVVVLNELLTLCQHVLCTLKIILHKQSIQELRNGVAVLIGLLLNDSDHILDGIASPLVDDDCSSQVAQQVLRGRLDGIEVPVQWCMSESLPKSRRYSVA